MVHVCTTAGLGALALGSFGCEVEQQFAAYEAALGTVSDSRSFARVCTLLRATCVDDRLGMSGVRRSLPHMPGGGMMLALMKHFVRGGLMQECSYFHTECLALQLGVGLVKEILRDPSGELELLGQLGVDLTIDFQVRYLLQDWAKNGLPLNFLDGAKPQEAFRGGHNPILAVVNRYRPGYTLRQEAVAASTDGYLAFSLDFWAAAPLAAHLTEDRHQRKCLTALYLLLSAGTLRRVGSSHLQVAVV